MKLPILCSAIYCFSLIDHTPTGGKGPRNFALDPAGKFLLTPTGQSLPIGAPVSIQFVPVK